MKPSKSVQIRKDIQLKLPKYGIEGTVESVVYPVSTKDIGLPGTETRDAAVVTFSTEICK